MVAFLVILAIAAWPVMVHGEQTTSEATMDPACPKELTIEMLAQLWQRRPSSGPHRDASIVTIQYRNDYGQPADAVLFALDGVTLKLKCNVPEHSGGVIFDGPLNPGVHHLDAVFNFGLRKGGRGGRSPLTFRVKRGRSLSLIVVVGRNDEEWPVAFVEPVRPRPPTNGAKHRN